MASTEFHQGKLDGRITITELPASGGRSDQETSTQELSSRVWLFKQTSSHGSQQVHHTAVLNIKCVLSKLWEKCKLLKVNCNLLKILIWVLTTIKRQWRAISAFSSLLFSQKVKKRFAPQTEVNTIIELTLKTWIDNRHNSVESKKLSLIFFHIFVEIHFHENLKRIFNI